MACLYDDGLKFKNMEGLFKSKYRASSIRLQNYDYSDDGYYFVTICTKNKNNFFGIVRDQQMILNNLGIMAVQYWLDIPKHFPDCLLDAFVVMPNHVHGIIIINNKNPAVETRHGVSLRKNDNFNKFSKPVAGSLSVMINQYKSAVKRWCNKNHHQNFIWQSGFYEHIIRNEESLFNIQNYIQMNPEMWGRDRNNPDILFGKY